MSQTPANEKSKEKFSDYLKRQLQRIFEKMGGRGRRPGLVPNYT